MFNKKSTWFILPLLAVLFLPAPATAATFPDAPDGTFEYVAVQSGAWHNTATWGGGSIPGTGDDVRIPSTCNGSACLVTVQRQEPNGIRHLKVEGEFRLWIHSSTRLEVETIYIDSGATFRIGAAGSNYVKAGNTAEVVFTSSGAIDTSWDPKQLSRGLVSDGTIRFYGEPKTHMAPVSRNVPSGATSISMDFLPGDWNVGDDVVLTGSYFRRDEPPTSSQDEQRTISGFITNGISFSGGLSHDHERPTSAMDLHVANLTRNIVFRSDSTSLVRDRGHVMLRNGDVAIHNTAFIGLGRTDKRIPLDDLDVTLEPNSTSPTSFSVAVPAGTPSNPRGRYSLHFHRNGANPGGAAPSTVHNSVVWDAIGWGFVNHSSHVDFQENVAYDFIGGGFVTESGDELGNFHDNIAIRGVGDGDFDPIFRFVFNNAQRPQPLSDFAFRGHGFWFQGPALSVVDNVASGCDGAGMVWFTPGAPNPDSATFYTDTDGYQKNKYVHFPRTWIDSVYGAGATSSINPRFWQHNAGETGNSRTVISDLPILEMDGFEAYGNYVGFRLRFNNSNNNAWYNDTTFDYALKIQTAGATNRATQTIENLKLWNNQQAFRMRYANDTDWSNVTAVNRLAYDTAGKPFAGHDGAEFFHSLVDHEFLDTLVIDGYPVAGRIEHGTADERAEFTFNGQSYSNYANFDAWHSGISCTQPTGSVTSAGFGSATISWTNVGDDYLVRYRETANQSWEFTGPLTGTSTTLSGLSSGQQHEFQVVAGCQVTIPSGTHDTLSKWSTSKTFTP